MKSPLAGRTTRLFPALLAVGLLCAVPALAQPGGDGAPGMNGGPGRPGGRGGNRAAMQAMMLQRQMERAGYTDAATIEAVTTYMTNREAARKPIVDAANALSEALADEDSTDAEITPLIDELDAAIAAEKARVVTAEADLDKQINFGKEPKIKAVLMLAGVIGDAAEYLPQQGGRGGRGGRGGQGGRGGRRGGNG